MAWGQPNQSLSKSNAAYHRAQSRIKANLQRKVENEAKHKKAIIRLKRRKIQSKIKAQMNEIKHLPKGKLSKKARSTIKNERKKLRATIKKERKTLRTLRLSKPKKSTKPKVTKAKVKKKRVSYKGMSKAKKAAIIKQHKITRLQKKIAGQKRKEQKKINSLKKKAAKAKARAAKTKLKNYFRNEITMERRY